MSVDTAPHQPLVTGFERGFEIAGAEETTAFNAAIGNETGFYVRLYGNLLKANVAIANSGFGIEVVQDGQIIRGNIVNANTTGIRVSGTSTLGIKHQITGNSVEGSGNDGILIDEGSEATVTGNNLYGTFNNCGLTNDANAGIVATGNYWGAASGPGSPPADNVCNIAGATTDVSGFLKKPVKVRSRLKLESSQEPMAIEAGENEEEPPDPSGSVPE